MTRFFDMLLSFFGLVFFSPLLLALYLVCHLDTGDAVFRQVRVGRNSQPFTLLKFRTMRIGTESVATHLADASAITKSGRFLRRTKLDELPQLWNVLKGEMSLVGPRPCLLNQSELIAERDLRGVLNARPGVTGLAQVKGVDMSIPRRLAEMDALMLQEMNSWNYFKYIFLTIFGSGAGDRI